MNVAIVGSGIAGLGAAYVLGAHSVTMFEAAARPGGHVYTVDVDGVAVDMGFIVHNRAHYPQFTALLRELDIETRPTAMAFSVADGDDEWGSGSLSAMFANRAQLANPRHWRFLVEVVRFLARARADLSTALVAESSLDQYLTARRVSKRLRDRFVIPLAAALWSLAPERCGEFPAISYLTFLDQHGMLSPWQPVAWRTIAGGSRRYIEALLARLAKRSFALELATPVETIVRDAAGVTVFAANRERRFDRLILACHADTALDLLADPSAEERAALGAFHYSTNRTVLHTDRSFLPKRRAAHASWNYVADPDTARVNVTYSMTRLQGLPDRPYLVTLNPRREPRGILHEVELTHPQFDRAGLAARTVLERISGDHHTYFAGAHFGFGFHEDGLASGRTAALRLLADADAARATRSA
jgi:predicted NAD/FAD-binding protein